MLQGMSKKILEDQKWVKMITDGGPREKPTTGNIRGSTKHDRIKRSFSKVLGGEWAGFGRVQFTNEDTTVGTRCLTGDRGLALPPPKDVANIKVNNVCSLFSGTW